MGDRGGGRRCWREWKVGRGSRQHEAPEEGFPGGGERLGSFPRWTRGPWLQRRRKCVFPACGQPKGQGSGGGWVQLLECHFPLVWSLFPHCYFETDDRVVHFMFGEVEVLQTRSWERLCGAAHRGLSERGLIPFPCLNHGLSRATAAERQIWRARLDG